MSISNAKAVLGTPVMQSPYTCYLSQHLSRHFAFLALIVLAVSSVIMDGWLGWYTRDWSLTLLTLLDVEQLC